MIWFLVLGLRGVIHIVQTPSVLLAVNPAYAVTFLAADGLRGFLVLGTVFLVLPALLLNYFGQGAFLLASPEATANPFYLMAPSWATLPLVTLSTMASIIASQALISGVFSITRQAQNLGFLPRLRIIHTSATEFGQIYIPFVNWLLMAACIIVVIGFQTSSNLAGAYGIAVTSTMAITTAIFAVVARERWGWGWPRVVGLGGFFLIVDLTFLAANLVKIPMEGWFAIVAAVAIFTVMTTWKRGSRLVNEREQNLEQDLSS